MEHKYSRTTLWLEYMSDEQTYPVPFNLLPTISGIKNFVANFKHLLGKTPICQCPVVVGYPVGFVILKNCYQFD